MTAKAGKDKSLRAFISRDYLAVLESESVDAVLQFLRKKKEDFREKFAYVYVLNQERKLKGVLSTRDLLTEDPTRKVCELMRRAVVFVSQDDSLEHVRKLLDEHDLLAVPVVDQSNCLIGVIQASQVNNDLRSSHSNPRLSQSFLGEEIASRRIAEIILKRTPWLVISVTTSLVCAYILGTFIGKIESIIALVLFVPIVLGAAGSAGTQLARVTVREMMQKRLKVSYLVRLFGKEVLVGFAIACIVFIPSLLIALLWRKMPIEGIVLSVSVMVSVAAAGILGMISPVLLRMLRVDSELASGLFALVICDIVAFVLYFVIALAFVNPILELG